MSQSDDGVVVAAPVLLGDGVRLFERPAGARVRLEPLSVTDSMLWMRVAR